MTICDLDFCFLLVFTITMSPDHTIDCIDCNEPFPFSEGEANFFITKGLVPPKRCKPCRVKNSAKHANKANSHIL